MEKDNHLISCRKQFIFSNDKDFNLFDPERILVVAPANNEISSEFDVMSLFGKKDRIDLEKSIHLFFLPYLPLIVMGIFVPKGNHTSMNGNDPLICYGYAMDISGKIDVNEIAFVFNLCGIGVSACPESR